MWSGEFELFHHFYFKSPEISTAVKTAIIIITIIVIALASLITVYFIRGDMWSGEFELFHHFYFQSPEKSIIAIIVTALASLMTIYILLEETCGLESLNYFIISICRVPRRAQQ